MSASRLTIPFINNSTGKNLNTMSWPSEISWISIQYNFYLWPQHFPGKLNQLSTDWVNCSFPMTLTTFSLLTRISLPAGPLCQACLHRCLYYNLGRKKNGTINPLPPQSNYGGVKGAKTCHFGIIEMGGRGGRDVPFTLSTSHARRNCSTMLNF